MNQAAPELRSLARELVVYETPEGMTPGAKAPAGFHVTEKLRPHLANLMGKGGFRALLARALALASAEVSWLNGVKANAEGALDGLEALRSQIDPAEFLDGEVVILAQLLGLLVSLIGADLTTRLIKEIWPKLGSTISLSVDSEVQSEKAK
jgi:hypothetical protein